MPSNKMSKADLDAKVKETLDSLEDEEQEIKESVEQLVKQDEETSDDEEQNTPEEEQEEVEVETPQEEKTPTIEERYKESTRESQVLYAQQKKFRERVEEATRLDKPSESELKLAYPSWDDMTETEKLLAESNLVNMRKFDLVYQATQEGKEIEEWAEKVDVFLRTAVEGKQFGALSGNEDDFRRFAMKPTRRGLELEDLAKLYLYDMPVKKSTSKKGSLLETASGGGEKTTTNNQNSLSTEQVAYLRKNHHKTYQKYVKEGKIKISV